MKCSRALILPSCIVVGILSGSSVAAHGSVQRQDVHRTVEGGRHSNLRAAAAKIDITPPVGTPLAGYGDRDQGSTGVRDSLRAGILVLDDGRTRAALITLDLINAGDDETRLIRELVGSRAGIPERHILVAASHTHGGPPFDAESEYARGVAARVAEAAAASLSDLRPVTFGYEFGEMTSCVNRRLLNDNGIAEMKANPSGVVDRRVKVLRFDASPSEPSALVILVACHANVFRNENTEITADYPGLVQTFVEDAFDGAPALFLAGAGGNIRPNLPSDDGFRSGDDLDLRWVGLDIGAGAVQAAARAGSAEALARRDTTYQIAAMTRSVALPGNDGTIVDAEIQALRIGRTLFLTIPGEPFVEYAMQLEQALPDDINLFVVGYANGHHGYICTRDSFEYGGFEPGVSRLAPETEAVLLDALIALARRAL